MCVCRKRKILYNSDENSSSWRRTLNILPPSYPVILFMTWHSGLWPRDSVSWRRKNSETEKVDILTTRDFRTITDRKMIELERKENWNLSHSPTLSIPLWLRRCLGLWTPCIITSWVTVTKPTLHGSGLGYTVWVGPFEPSSPLTPPVL